MNYTTAQIEKLLLERECLRNTPCGKELAQIDAELDQVLKTQDRAFIDAVKIVYQENRA